MDIMSQINNSEGKPLVTEAILLEMNKSKIVQLKKERMTLEQEEKNFLYNKNVQVNKYDHEHYDLMYSENYYRSKQGKATELTTSEIHQQFE